MPPLYQQHDQEILAGKEFSAIIPVKDADGNNLLFLHSTIRKTDEYGNLTGLTGHAVEIFNTQCRELISMLSKINPQKTPIFKLGKSVGDIKFSLREEQCLFYLLYGKTAKAIAKVLGISPRTVEKYIEQLKVKFNCLNKMELIDKAIKMGYLDKIANFSSIKNVISVLKE